MTEQALTEAKAFFDEVLEKEVTRGMAEALADPSRFRIISEPSFGDWKLDTQEGAVLGTMEVQLGEVQACVIERNFLPGSNTWTLRSMTFDGSFLDPEQAAYSYSLVFQPYDSHTKQPQDGRLFFGTVEGSSKIIAPLTDCSA